MYFELGFSNATSVTQKVYCAHHVVRCLSQVGVIETEFRTYPLEVIAGDGNLNVEVGMGSSHLVSNENTCTYCAQ
jgi:hypothetical protein